MLEYALGKDRIFFYVRPRLGKTTASIRWAESFKPGKVLVVAPTSTLEATWKKELAAEGLTCCILRGNLQEKLDLLERNKNERWFIINYQGLYEWSAGKNRVREASPSRISLLPWDVLIADETATYIRNPKATITKTLCYSFPNTHRRVALCGVPDPEGLMDWFTQMCFVFGDCMGHTNFWHWRETFFQKKVWGWDWYAKPGTSEALKKHIRERVFILRSMPGMEMRRIMEVRHVELPTKTMKIYRNVEKDWAVTDDLQTKWATTKSMWLCQVAGGCCLEDAKHSAKTGELLEMLKGEHHGENVVVSFRFNDELHHVQKLLEKNHILCGTLTGASPPEKRAATLEKFGKRFNVLLVQARVAHVGLDLSKGDTLIHFSRYWEGNINWQLEARLDNPKRKLPPLHVDLVAKGTVDEEVVSTVREKRLSSTALALAIQGKLKRRLGL